MPGADADTKHNLDIKKAHIKLKYITRKKKIRLRWNKKELERKELRIKQNTIRTKEIEKRLKDNIIESTNDIAGQKG